MAYRWQKAIGKGDKRSLGHALNRRATHGLVGTATGALGVARHSPGQPMAHAARQAASAGWARAGGTSRGGSQSGGRCRLPLDQVGWKRCHDDGSQWHHAPALWGEWAHRSGRSGAPRHARQARHVVANQRTAGRHRQARLVGNRVERGADRSRGRRAR
jgi:hypothetical protein